MITILTPSVLRTVWSSNEIHVFKLYDLGRLLWPLSECLYDYMYVIICKQCLEVQPWLPAENIIISSLVTWIVSTSRCSKSEGPWKSFQPLSPLSFLLLPPPSPLCQHRLLVFDENESTCLIISKVIQTLNFLKKIYSVPPPCVLKTLQCSRSVLLSEHIRGALHAPVINLNLFYLLRQKPWNPLPSTSSFSSLITNLTSSFGCSFFKVLIFIL